MTYGLQCEALRFVWRNESFRFRRFWPRNGQLPNGRESSGESRRPSCPKTLEVPHSQFVQRSDGQHRLSRAVRSHQHPLRFWSVFDAAPAALRTTPPVGSPGAKKLRKSALKSLKQLARVNLCAAPKQGSEADDSR
jgi:hypothetical protein